MLKIETVVCGALEENAYIVSKEGEEGAFVIDPGDDYAALVRALAGRRLEAVCLTHAHYDHMLAVPGLIADTGAKLYAGARDIPALNDERLNLYNAAWSRLPAPRGLKAIAYGEALNVCGACFAVLPTPGHTPGGVCLWAQDEGVLFSGDTLFCAGYGRVDFPGSNAADMRASLLRLFELPGETRVYPGHGEATTIARERARYQV